MSGFSRSVSSLVIVLSLSTLAARAAAQDITKLRINEVLSSNKATQPVDPSGKFNDLLEIYNPTDAEISLAGMIIANQVVKDDGGVVRPGDPPASFTLDQGSIRSKAFILIFCDGKGGFDVNGNSHASFKLSKDGDLVAIFTPAGDLIDQVAFPALADDGSYGRSPDGSDTLCSLLAPTFKEGPVISGGALDAQNSPCGNLPPVINFLSLASAESAAGVNPAAGAAVSLLVDTTDDQVDGIARAQVIYRVDGGAEVEAALQFGAISQADPHLIHWSGSIPGQAAGAQVTFRLKAVDSSDAVGNDPDPLCQDPPATGCKPPYRYRVANVYQGPLVLNEVGPNNVTLLKDPATSKFEDYLEIYNRDSANPVSLAGLWLSTNPFQPQGWQFPAGSSLAAGQHLLVWCDKKDTKTDPSTSDFHTSFNLSKQADGVFLFESDASGLGLIDGLKFGLTADDQAWSRVPDGDRSSPFVLQTGTPLAANVTPGGSTFVRGDADRNGKVDLQDTSLVIEYLFLGGVAPPCLDAADADDSSVVDLTDAIDIAWSLFGAAGPLPAPFPAPGADPTPDSLGCGS